MFYWFAGSWFTGWFGCLVCCFVDCWVWLVGFISGCWFDFVVAFVCDTCWVGVIRFVNS